MLNKAKYVSLKVTDKRFQNRKSIRTYASNYRGLQPLYKGKSAEFVYYVPKCPLFGGTP